MKWFVEYVIGTNILRAGPYAEDEVLKQYQDIKTYTHVTDVRVVGENDKPERSLT